jgi:cytochrome c peroxidase
MTRTSPGARFFVPLLLLGLLFFLIQIVPALAPRPEDSGGRAGVSIGNRVTLERGYARWRAAADRSGEGERLRLDLHPPAAHVTARAASGRLELDLVQGRLRLRAERLGAAERYELWVLHRAGTPPPPAGEGRGALRVRLGAFRGEEARQGLDFSLAPVLEARLEADRFAVVPEGADPARDALLAGSPSLFQKMFYAEERSRSSLAAAVGRRRGAEGLAGLARPWLALVPEPALAASASSPGLDSLIAFGESLFVFETFGGNGRTCATCHPPHNNFTLDTAFIASRPPEDPLFVAEFDTNLAGLENPLLMRQFSLILENVDGLEDPTNKFVMRGVPHTLGLALSITAPDTTSPPKDRVGWGGDGAPNQGRLRDFAVGAVRQHFTKTLARVVDVDFRFPTDDELDALEAFQLSLGRSEDPRLNLLELTNAVADSGRKLFLQTDSEGGTKPAGKCVVCHRNGSGTSTLFGANDNFDTGIENRVHPAALTGERMPNDGGFGTAYNAVLDAFGNGEFNTPPVVESADTPPFFHNNLDFNLANTVAFYSTPVFNNSPAGQLLKSMDSANLGINVPATEVTAFLRVLNALENLRSAVSVLVRALGCADSTDAAKLLLYASSELVDAHQVLTQGNLHADARAHVQSADSLTNLAVGEGDWGVRYSLIGAAIPEANTARDLMVVGGVVDAAPSRSGPGIALASGYPNPFVGSTLFSFTLPHAGRARLAVYDVGGRLVRLLADGQRDPGPHTVRWDGRTGAGREAPSGSYFVRLDALGESRVRTVVRLR